MRGVGKKRIAITVLILFAVVLMGVGCASKQQVRWGKVLQYKGDSLFYTSKVTEEEAHRVVISERRASLQNVRNKVTGTAVLCSYLDPDIQ